jgi:hypothetical protein
MLLVKQNTLHLRVLAEDCGDRAPISPSNVMDAFPFTPGDVGQQGRPGCTPTNNHVMLSMCAKQFTRCFRGCERAEQSTVHPTYSHIHHIYRSHDLCDKPQQCRGRVSIYPKGCRRAVQSRLKPTYLTYAACTQG